MLALINGGGAVAILAYLGNTHSTQPALMTPALQDFCGGLLLVALALLTAYLAQLQLYNEEREAHLKRQFVRYHAWPLGLAIVFAFASATLFGVGCLCAAAMLGKIQ